MTIVLHIRKKKKRKTKQDEVILNNKTAYINGRGLKNQTMKILVQKVNRLQFLCRSLTVTEDPSKSEFKQWKFFVRI